MVLLLLLRSISHIILSRLDSINEPNKIRFPFLWRWKRRYFWFSWSIWDWWREEVEVLLESKSLPQIDLIATLKWHPIIYHFAFEYIGNNCDFSPARCVCTKLLPSCPTYQRKFLLLILLPLLLPLCIHLLHGPPPGNLGSFAWWRCGWCCCLSSLYSFRNFDTQIVAIILIPNDGDDDGHERGSISRWVTNYTGITQNDLLSSCFFPFFISTACTHLVDTD